MATAVATQYDAMSTADQNKVTVTRKLERFNTEERQCYKKYK